MGNQKKKKHIRKKITHFEVQSGRRIVNILKFENKNGAKILLNKRNFIHEKERYNIIFPLK